MAGACNDCHTNQTVWPWYSKVPPVSFWVADHVEEGRSHFNLSAFGAYSPRQADHKLEEMIEMVEEGKMPLKSYKWGHSEARITDAQREVLIDWARAERERIGYVPEEAAPAPSGGVPNSGMVAGEAGAGAAGADADEGHL